MIYLFVGDLHIKSDNRDDIDLLLTELIKILADEQYDAVILGGDVMHYHERLFTQPLNQALHFIQTLATITKVYVLVGNHDYINNSQFLTQNHWMNVLKEWNNVVVVDTPITVGMCMFVPYVPPGRFIEAMDTVNKRWNYLQVIFCHQEFRGCKMGAITSADGDEWDDEFPLVVSGHIHDHQMVGQKIVYPGTPLQHAYGDSTIRRLCVVNVGESEVKYRFLDLNVPRKHILKCSIGNVSEVLSNTDRHDRIRLKLDATAEEFALFKKTAQFKELSERGIRVQVSSSSSSSVSDEKSEVAHQPVHFLTVLGQLVSADEPIVRQLFDEMITK